MVFGESPAKDVYRRIVWGPYRRSFQHLPLASELRANRLLGLAVSRFARGKREAVRANLARAFPGRDLDPILSEVFATHFSEQYISWSFARITPTTAGAYLHVVGREHLDAALSQGRGAVLVHPHMGPAQLPLCVLAHLGYRMNQIGGGGVDGVVQLSPTGRWAESMRHRLEQDIPARIWDGGKFIRPVLRALTDGQVVMTAMDGTGGGKELGRRYVRTVLGQRMTVPVGAYYLGIKARCPVLPLVTFHNVGPGAPYMSRIGPPLALPREAPLDDALERCADLAAELLERELVAHPGDWHFWDEFQPGRFVVEEA